jgi:hypothetical protein
MGTSASSKGPGGGVPMVPPWVPDPPPPLTPPPTPMPEDGDGANPDNGGDDGSGGQDTSPSTPTAAGAAVARIVQVAPAARFGGARSSLGKFARSGDGRDMRRGVKHYVRTGYGGGSAAVKRFGGTISTAGALYGALSGAAGGQSGPTTESTASLDQTLLAGHSAREVMDALIESVRPADGTQDAEASRAAIRDALAEVLTMFPDADLLLLSEDQREFAIERFVAIDVYRRLQLDLGKTIQEKAPTATVGLARLKEVKNYVKETVAAAFRKLRAVGTRISTGRVNQVVRTAIGETFQIFEGYIS